MNLKITKAQLIEFFKGLAVGIIIVIGTFTVNDWSISVGIDSPLSWAYNYFFAHGLNIGRNIVFPHGPLAFVMYPTQENILLATLIISILKILVVFNLLRIINDFGKVKWFISFVVAYIISMLSNINYLILVNIILYLLSYYNLERKVFKIDAFILTAFAFYIKSDVAIMSGVICASFIAYYFFTTKNYKTLLFDILTIIGLYILIWFLMYRTFSGFINYIIGMYNLAQDNSSAVSYYPYNNWWLLSLFILIIFIIPFINKTKKSFFYSILVVLSLFAAWKHGMAREDLMHANGFLTYVIILLIIFILFINQKSFRNTILSIIAISLLTLNLKHSTMYFAPKYELFGINYFAEFITDYSKLKTKAIDETNRDISINKLPQNILDSIKSETVDVYPWDYSIIAANNLNWKPRIVIQSYASYTSWLDNKNAAYFNSDNAPSFLIWDLKGWEDINGSNINSIDARYLLNDEPQTIIQILKKYKPYYIDRKFMVFKKRETPIKTKNTIIANNSSKWDKWNTVPNISNGLLRLKLSFKKSILERLKSFFYKDEQVWVYLKFSDNTINKYRIIPENAKDGIWINPYIFNTTNKHIDSPVTEVMFRCSNETIMNKDLDLKWEHIEFENEPDYINKFFGKTEQHLDSIYLTSVNTFELNEFKNWDKVPAEQIINTDYNSGSRSQLIKANSFSTTFTFPLDSLPFTKLKIAADCWVKSINYKYSNNILLLLSIDDNTKNVIWYSLPIDQQLIDNKRWNNILSFIDFDHQKRACTLKVNIWNTSNEDLYVDDFRVIISKSNNP